MNNSNPEEFKLNYYALCVAILTKCTVSSALSAMGLTEGMNKNAIEHRKQN